MLILICFIVSLYCFNCDSQKKEYKRNLRYFKLTMDWTIMKPCEQKTQKVSYIKMDNNVVINEKCIRWIKKIDECLEVCTNPTRCSKIGGDIQSICKQTDAESYEKLNRHFK